MAVRYLDYIESDGSAYFPTGVTPTANTKIEFKADVTSGHFFAASASSTYRFGVYLLTTGAIDMAFGSTGYKGSVLTGITYPAVVTLENGKLTANGAEYTFTTQSAFTANALSLFAEGTAASPGRVEYCKHWENGELVHYWKAALDESGVACFYDEVNKTYGYGEGTFTAGPIKIGTLCRLPKRIGSVKTQTYSVTLSGVFDENYGYVTIDGVKYSAAQTVEAKAGATIYVHCMTSMGAVPATITVDGTEVANSGSAYTATHTFTLAGNTTIAMTKNSSATYCYNAAITTESSGGTTPSEYAITVTGTGSSDYCYTIINGTKVTSAGTYAVSVGDSITCAIVCMNAFGTNTAITLNGTTVATSSFNSLTTYDYTPDSNATIELQYTNVNGGAIAITTE